MTLYAIPPLLGSITFVSVGLFVLASKPRNNSKILFSILCLQSFWWQLAWFVSYFFEDLQFLKLFVKIVYIPIIFIPFTFYHFVIDYLGGKKEAGRIRFFYIFGGIFSVLVFTSDYFIRGIQKSVWGYFPTPGPLYIIDVAIAIYANAAGLIMLVREAATTSRISGNRRQQILYLIIGFGFYSLCTLDFLQVYGAKWYPTGTITFTISALVIGHAITRHQLLDIKVVIQKSFFYSVLTASISLIYLVMVFAAGQLPALLIDSGISLEPNSGNTFLLRQHFLAYIVTCVTTLGLATFVYLAGKKRETNVVFALYTLTISLWSGAGAFAFVSSNAENALFLWRISKGSTIFIAVFFVHFVMSLAPLEIRMAKRRWISGAYVVGAGLLLFDLSGQMISRVEPKLYFLNYPSPTISYVVFFATWAALVGIGLYHLFDIRKKLNAEQRNQLNYFCAATLVAYVGGVANFLPTFDIYVPILMPFGNYAIPIYVLVSVYAIVAKRLMDIQIVIRQAFFYFILALLISLLYVALIFIAHRFFATDSPHFGLMANLALILVIALLFKPIEIVLLRLIEKRFFKGSIYEIAEQKDRLQQELERRERLKAVGILASGMAHEIKNPLTAINTFMEYLPQKQADLKFMENFQRIVNGELQRIGGIVQELLDFSKPKPLEPKPVDLNAIIRDTLDLLSKNMMMNKVTCDFQPSGDIKEIVLDPNRMKQALLNIIMNAIDAMKKGGGVLKVDTAREGGWVRINVADTGCGIAKDKLPNIFDPFYSQKDSGTGLGLPITHAIVEQHKGRILVTSVAGKGTAFMLYLPIGL